MPALVKIDAAHPIEQLHRHLCANDYPTIDLLDDIERARVWFLQQIQSLHAKLVLLDVLDKALKAVATGENSVLVSLLYEKDYVGLDAWALDYGEKGLDAANLTGVAKIVFEALLSCELNPSIKPWCSGDDPSNFALYISW